MIQSGNTFADKKTVMMRRMASSSVNQRRVSESYTRMTIEKSCLKTIPTLSYSKVMT
jgi:hypothetical protein